MAKLTVKQIQDLARSIVAKAPGGIRFRVVVNMIYTANPENSKNTIDTTVSSLATRFPAEITKPNRGLFVPANAAGSTILPPDVPPPTLAEEAFYVPFADWLKNDLDEATVAIRLGEAGLKKNGERRTLSACISLLPPTASNSLWKSSPRRLRSIRINL